MLVNNQCTGGKVRARSVVSGGRDYRRIELGSYDLRYLSEVVERGLAV